MALRRQDWMILGGIFTCALTLRIGCLYYFALSRELSPFELSSDGTYHSLALDLLLGFRLVEPAVRGAAAAYAAFRRGTVWDLR